MFTEQMVINSNIICNVLFIILSFLSIIYVLNGILGQQARRRSIARTEKLLSLVIELNDIEDKDEDK